MPNVAGHVVAGTGAPDGEILVAALLNANQKFLDVLAAADSWRPCDTVVIFRRDLSLIISLDKVRLTRRTFHWDELLLNLWSVDAVCDAFTSWTDRLHFGFTPVTSYLSTIDVEAISSAINLVRGCIRP